MSLFTKAIPNSRPDINRRQTMIKWPSLVAMALCAAWGIPNEDFLKAVEDFTGAAGRLERKLDLDLDLDLDFIHSEFPGAPGPPN